jgi:putative ATPase
MIYPRMSDLFRPSPSADPAERSRPLADRMRPSSPDDLLGQDALIADGGTLRALLAGGHVPSLILWGPPGCGKTTLARLIASHAKSRSVSMSAIDAGAAEIRAVFREAEQARALGQETVLTVDEIHRFNRSQQDLFLPYVENGAITLIGATTENPSFALNAALLSRCRVVTLKALDDAALRRLLARAETFVGLALPLDDAAKTALCRLAGGDGRYLLGVCEELFALGPCAPLDEAALLRRIGRRRPVHDKAGDGHYNLLSAFHKSLRASDVDAALYWAARMVAAGEDPLTILRRLTACAAEDVGTADPHALPQALAARDAHLFLGWPESRQALAQAIVYVATAPKSNAAYQAFDAAMADAEKTGAEPPPLHAVNAPTKTMKDEGYGTGYIYDHDVPEGCSGLCYFPVRTGRRRYYRPQERGFEREISKRLEYFARIREGRKEKPS